MTDCLFCKIANREIPASVVYEDERVVAFNDINPQAPTHVLVIPKRHIASLNEISVEDDQIVGELVRRAAAIARERGLAPGGFRTVFNTNRDAGQTVFHVHLHLLGGRSMTATGLDSSPPVACAHTARGRYQNGVSSRSVGDDGSSSEPGDASSNTLAAMQRTARIPIRAHVPSGHRPRPHHAQDVRQLQRGRRCWDAAHNGARGDTTAGSALQLSGMKHPDTGELR